MKCPVCGTNKLDFETEHEQQGILLLVYCTLCDYEAVTSIDADAFKEDRPRLKMDANGNLTRIEY